MAAKKINHYTEFYINGGHDYEKWITQNHGVIIDYRDGCLQDHELIGCKGGVAVVNEHYINTNMSDLKVKFYRNPLIGYACWDDFTNEFDAAV